MSEKGHSEEWFGDYRDYWYNQDFLELMAKRWNLSRVNSLLDVGCGLCHWSRLISQFLPTGAQISGLDADPKWGSEKQDIIDKFKARGMDFQVFQGDAYALPFADNSFDAVTCQTLLIHLANPLKALQEMYRVVKPGGIIICAEPNNLVPNLTRDSVSQDYSIEETVDAVMYALVCEKGYVNCGGGDSSLGDLVPGLMQKIGLKEIKTYLSDKANMLIPPYDTPEMQVFVELSSEDNPFEGEIEEDTLKYFQSFGDKYIKLYKRMKSREPAQREIFKKAIAEQRYHSAGSFLMYLVSGRK